MILLTCRAGSDSRYIGRADNPRLEILGMTILMHSNIRSPFVLVLVNVLWQGVLP